MPSSGRWMALFAGEFRRLRAASYFAHGGSSSQSPLDSVSAWRRKLRSFPCSSSSRRTHFAGLRREQRGIGQNAAGDGSDEHFVLIVAFPRTPLRGTRTCWILQNFRRAKSEWRSAIPTAPQGAGCSKIAVGAVYRLRLALPSHRSWCEFGREAQGPPLPRLRIVFGNP